MNPGPKGSGFGLPKGAAQGLRHRAVICRWRFEVGGLRRKIDGDFFASNLERSLLSGPPTSYRVALGAMRFDLAAWTGFARTESHDRVGFSDVSRLVRYLRPGAP